MTDRWTLDNTAPRVKAILAAIDRSQAELATALGINPVTISRWCTGKSTPDRRSKTALEKLEEKYIHAQDP